MVELAKKDNGLKELTPFMGNDKTLSSASYMLRLKRVQLERQESENKVESLINDYLTVAKEYVNTESNEEIGLAIKEIKQEIFNVCEDINNIIISQLTLPIKALKQKQVKKVSGCRIKK